MSNGTQVIESMDSLANFFERKSFFVTVKTHNRIVFMAHELDKQDGETSQVVFDSGIVETAQDAYDKYESWSKDNCLWGSSTHKALIIYDLFEEISVEEELLKLGFSNVQVAYENTNCINVVCTYCYRDSKNRFRYDGKLKLNNCGDKISTIEKVTEWINRNVLFIPTKNKGY